MAWLSNVNNGAKRLIHHQIQPNPVGTLATVDMGFIPRHGAGASIDLNKRKFAWRMDHRGHKASRTELLKVAKSIYRSIISLKDEFDIFSFIFRNPKNGTILYWSK